MKTKFFLWGACAVLLLMSACSNDSKMVALLEKVPFDADIVAVGDVKTIVESAGGSVEGSLLKMPRELLEDINEDDEKVLDNFESFLGKSGVDAEACAMTGSYKNSSPIVIFALNDPEAFKKAIGDEGFAEKSKNGETVFYSKKTYESEYDSLYDDYSYIAINDTYGYWVHDVWVGSKFKPEEAISDLINDAAKSPYSKTACGEYISSGNAAGLSFRIPEELGRKLGRNGLPDKFAELYEGVLCMKGNLADNEATVNMKWFDNDGNEKNTDEMEKYMDLNAKISSKALAYMNKDEQCIYAVCVKGMDWDRFMDDMSENPSLPRGAKPVLTVAKSYLEKFDGTIAVGFDIVNGLESFFKIDKGDNPLNELSATLVLETKEDKAERLVKDLKGLLESQNMPYDELPSGLALNIPGNQGTLYVKAEDDMIILSNRPISAENVNATVENTDFTDYIAAAGIYLGKDNKLMKDLKVDRDVKLTATGDALEHEGEFCMSISGDDSDGFIAKFLKTVVAVAKQAEEIEKDMRNRRY